MAQACSWRAALLATGLFLYINGYRLTASQADTTITMLNLAAGELFEEAFAAWLRQHAQRKDRIPPSQL